MKPSQIIYALIVAIIIGGIAWGLSFVRTPEPANATPPGEQTAQGDYVYTEGDAYYAVELHYPSKTSLSADANVAAMDTIQRGVQAELNVFKQDLAQMLSPDEKARLAEAGRRYEFGAEFKEFTSAEYNSFAYAFYQDTGGAHPNGYFKTFVFAQGGQQVTLGQVLSKNPNRLEELSLLVSQDVTKQMIQRLGDSAPQGVEGPDVTGLIYAEGVSPKEENFANFVVDKDDLVIFIPPYQVAAYAMGSFEVRIPLKDINK